MKVNEIPVKQNANQVTDPNTQVSAEEFNALVDNAKESVISMEVLAGPEEVKLSYGKGKGTTPTLTFPNATASGAGMMSPKQAARIADRTATDGMGYVVLDKDKSFAAQVTQENTIYEIRDEFSLDGLFEVKANCVLKFEGGSLINGTIKGNNTIISSNAVQIFRDIQLTGTFPVTGKPEWFGASVNNDSREALQQCISAFKVSHISGMYPINSAGKNGVAIEISEGHVVLGDKVGTVDSTDNSGLIVNSDAIKTVIKANNGCEIKNIHIKGNMLSREEVIGVGSTNTRSVSIDRVIISGMRYGIKMNTFLTTIKRVECWYNTYGFCFEGVTGIPFTSVCLINCYAAYNANAGYSMDKIIYSSLLNCACDSTGLNVTGGLNAEASVEGAYVLKNTHGVSLYNCGAEHNARSLFIDNSSNAIISGCDVQINSPELIGAEETKKHLLKNIHIRFSSNVTIEKSRISIYGEYSGTYLLVDDYRESVNVLTTDCIPQKAVSYYDNGVSVDLKNNVLIDIPKKITTEFKNYQENYSITTDNVTVYTIEGIENYIDNLTCKDYTNSNILHYKGIGDGFNQLILDMNDTKIFEGYKKVIFENLLISVSQMWGEGKEFLFEFIDTEAVFINCIFYISGENTKSLFKLTNSTVLWNNTYEYAYGNLRPSLINISSACLDYNLLSSLSDYNNYSRVLLPNGAKVVLTNGKSATVVGENVHILYDGGVKYVNANGIEVS